MKNDHYPSNLDIKIFADGADISAISEMALNPLIKGFTTNPTLMRKAGIEDYEIFAKEMLSIVPLLPVSLEVFADDLPEMERQARKISSWGDNVFVKLPITNTQGDSILPIAKRLSMDGIQLNITAMMTTPQLEEAIQCINDNVPTIFSIFAGRIADTGVDPVPAMEKAVTMLKKHPKFELLWASPREVLNIYQANEIGCHIITVTNDLIEKLSLANKDLNAFSLETVKMFYTDASAAGYKL